MIKEFKEFAMKGNLIDIAVGFVMGAAFKSVVTTFTKGIISPLIGLLFNTNFKSLKWIIQQGVVDSSGKVTGQIAVLYGEFITSLLDFIIIAFVMFMVVKSVNKLKKEKEETPPPTPKEKTSEELLVEIRDLLAKK